MTIRKEPNADQRRIDLSIMRVRVEVNPLVAELLAIRMPFESEEEALLALLGDGVRLRSLQPDPPMCTKYFTRLSPRRVIQEHLHFLDVVADQLGVLGRPCRYALAELPRGGRWEAEGYTGWVVIAKGWRFTPDGAERVNSEG